jgi:hypothetical protein
MAPLGAVAPKEKKMYIRMYICCTYTDPFARRPLSEEIDKIWFYHHVEIIFVPYEPKLNLFHNYVYC